MADPETAAVIAQMRKLLWLAKEAPRPLTDDQLLEFDAAQAMMMSWVSHRRPNHPMTEEQALEMATLMAEFRDLAEAAGKEPLSDEEAMARAEALLKMRPPTEN